MPVRPFAPHATVDPYPGHRRLLRRSSPYHEPDLGAWVVTRHSDILDILRNPRVFSSSGKTGVDDPSRIIILVNDDPPRHTERRALVQRPMTRRLNDDLDAWIERRVDQLLDAVDPGNVEAMGDFDGPELRKVRKHFEGQSTGSVSSSRVQAYRKGRF